MHALSGGIAVSVKCRAGTAGVKRNIRPSRVRRAGLIAGGREALGRKPLSGGRDDSCHRPAIRKMICTTNPVESLNRSLRKVIKSRGSFPSDDAALELLCLAIQHAALRWKAGLAWPKAKLQFMILFCDRITGQLADR
jgi:hypothetical protein